MRKITKVLCAIFLMWCVAPAIAQSPINTPIQVAEWKSIIEGPALSVEAGLRLSNQLAAASTNEIQNGNRATALRKILMSLTLSCYFSDASDQKGQANWIENRDSITGLEAALLSAGITRETMRLSRANLERVLPPASAKLGLPSSPRYLPVGAVDRAQIIAAIRDKMIDPASLQISQLKLYSPINGVKGACAVINAKNSFGGYTGRQSIPIYHTNTGWRARSPSPSLSCDDLWENFRNYALKV